MSEGERGREREGGGKIEIEVDSQPDFKTHPFPTLKGLSLYIPLVLMWEMSDASSILASSPIVTKSYHM